MVRPNSSNTKIWRAADARVYVRIRADMRGCGALLNEKEIGGERYGKGQTGAAGA